MPLPNTIAVDGPAGSGKSSVSFAVAQKLGYLFVDTGAFYRAVTLLALEQQIDMRDLDTLTVLTRRASLDITPDLADDGRQYTVLAGKRDITSLIHSPQVDSSVSIVAAASGVREALLDAQRSIARRGKVIMAGRDIGTVVLPDAELKIYIDASLDKRAERRYQQRIANHETADLETIRTGLAQRDSLDTNRDVAPLLRAEDAVTLDTSDLSFDEAVQAMLALVQNWTP